MGKTNNEKIHSSWQKFLAPLIGALVSAIGIYATAAQQQYSHDNDRRVAVMESRLLDLETLKADVKELSKEVHELVGEIRAERYGRLRR